MITKHNGENKMNFAQYTPTQATFIAAQWPKDPTLFDHQDLHNWLEADVLFAGQGGVWVQKPGKTTELKPGDYVLRDDDGFHVYSEAEFNDRFVEL